jgi:hypothetical protein
MRPVAEIIVSDLPRIPSWPDYPMHQCLLRNGNLERTSFLPTQFAVAGKILKLKDDEGEWKDGWKVEKVYSR